MIFVELLNDWTTLLQWNEYTKLRILQLPQKMPLNAPPIELPVINKGSVDFVGAARGRCAAAVLSKSIGTIFSTACAHSVYVSHFGNAYSISNIYALLQ